MAWRRVKQSVEREETEGVEGEGEGTGGEEGLVVVVEGVASGEGEDVGEVEETEREEGAAARVSVGAWVVGGWRSDKFALVWPCGGGNFCG